MALRVYPFRRQSSNPRGRVWAGSWRRWAAATFLWGVVAASGATISSPGITEPILDVTLGSPVAGIVAARHFDEGAFVNEGDVVIALDKTLQDLEAKRRQLALAPLKSELDGDRHLYETTGSVSKQELDKKELEYNVALVDLELAQEQIQQRLISAPIDGFIAEILVEAGEACQMQQPLARVVDTRRCLFICNLEARVGYKLKVGQKVDLEIAAGSQTVKRKGEISFVSPVVDPASGLMRVKAVFDNADNSIVPGVAGAMTFEEPSYVD